MGNGGSAQRLVDACPSGQMVGVHACMRARVYWCASARVLVCVRSFPTRTPPYPLFRLLNYLLLLPWGGVHPASPQLGCTSWQVERKQSSRSWTRKKIVSQSAKVFRIKGVLFGNNWPKMAFFHLKILDGEIQGRLIFRFLAFWHLWCIFGIFLCFQVPARSALTAGRTQPPSSFERWLCRWGGWILFTSPPLGATPPPLVGWSVPWRESAPSNQYFFKPARGTPEGGVGPSEIPWCLCVCVCVLYDIL